MSDKIAVRAAYGSALAKLANTNDKIVVLDADLSHATMTATFAKEHPDRFFNAGIAEADMVDMASGMAAMGCIPFCSTFAVFAGRCLDQIRNGVCYSHSNVKFGFSHAGITVGEDGGSHQAIEDLAIMRVMPGMTVIVPGDATECYKAVEAAIAIDGPVYLRLARLPTTVLPEQPFTVGKANVLREGKDVALITCGVMLEMCLEAAKLLEAKGIQARIVNMHTIKPIDREMVEQCASECGAVITVEEHSVIGGLGDAVADVLVGKGNFIFEKFGVNDVFGQSGKPAALLEEYGLSPAQIALRVEKALGK